MTRKSRLFYFWPAVPPRHLAGIVFTAVVLLAVTGCHIPCLCCPDQGAMLPGDFYGATCSHNSAYVGVEEFFNDPVLTHLIVQGLAQNQELKIRNQEIQIASNEIMARRGAIFPFVVGRARGGVDRTSKYTPLGAAEEQLTYPGGGRFPDPLPNIKLSTELFWQVDIWRELRNARDAAMQRYIETIEVRNYLITKIVAEISENYYELAALDKRLLFLNQTIEIQKQSLEVAKAQKAAGRGTELGVQRFLAEVRKNESQRLIVKQNIIEVENRINFLVGRFPQPVERAPWDYIHLDSQILCVGVPAELLLNRRDIQAAEREVAASGLDVLVARARFFPRLDITAEVGFEAFSPKYLFDPEAFIGKAFGDLIAPLINKTAIRADYLNANARQLQAVYEYQRVVLIAFTEVVNRMAKVDNYRRSVDIKREQVKALEESVSVASDLFKNARGEYIDVLFSQRDLLEAQTVLIETKQQQLAAIVNAYQALGGGYLLTSSGPELADLYCGIPGEISPAEVVLPPPIGDRLEELPPAEGTEELPAPAEEPEPVHEDDDTDDAETLPAPGDEDAQPLRPTTSSRRHSLISAILRH